MPVSASGFFTALLVWCSIAVVAQELAPNPSLNAPNPSPESTAGVVIASPLTRTVPDQPTVQRIRTCEISFGENPDLLSGLRAHVVLRQTGVSLVSFRENDPVPPASVQKLFIAAAALKVLGPEHRLTTSVWANGFGEAWLVGGGDPTISRAPGNNYYGAKHSLAELAEMAVSRVAHLGLAPIEILHVDRSRYDSFETWDESWREGAWSLGYIAPVAALQVDGDRDSPSMRLGKRSQIPEARAQAWFVQTLNSLEPVDDVRIGNFSRPVDAFEIARVESAPVREQVSIMLLDSDNTLAEVLAREVAISQGNEDFTSAILDGIGWDEEQRSQIYFQDGSGLSPLNRLSAISVTTALEAISSDEELLPIVGFLPVSSETGSLKRRFQTSDPSLAGVVSAKTGSIEGVRSLAGYITASDGENLIFSLHLSGPRVNDTHRSDLDQVVAGLYLCGENLAHWEKADVSTTE